MCKKRVAIIGGGIAGLVAANELTRLAPNADVTLFERSKNLGGRASTIQKDSAYLNQGAHALYNDGALNNYLKRVGASVVGAPPPNSNSLAYTNGSFKRLPGDLVSLATTSLLNLSEKLVLGQFWAELPDIETSTIMSITLRDWLDERFGRSTLTRLIEALTRLGTYAHAPSIMSAGTAINQLKVGQGGVRYLDYGWQSIVEGLRSSLNRPVTERVDMQVSAVEEVATEEGQRVIVTAGGSTEFFDFAILAVPPGTVEKIAPATLPRNFTQTLSAAKIACFDICLDSLPNPENKFVLGLEEPLYYSVHSAAAKLSDDGSVVLHMGVYLEAGENGGLQHLNMMIGLLDKLQPGWQDRVIYKRFLPNMVASFATPLAERNGLGGLASPSLPGSTRILAAGDWVGAGHFLADASAASALEAAKIVSTGLKNASLNLVAA